MAASLDDLESWLIKVTEHTRLTHEALEKGPGGTAGGAKPEASNGEKFAVAAGKAQAALGAFVGAFDKAIAVLGNGMSRFVQLANPGTVYRFNLAVENAMSALGRILTPALETAGHLIQQLGNAVESLSPQAKRLVAGMVIATGVAAGLAAAVAAIGAVASVVGGPVTLLIALGSALVGLTASGAGGARAAAEFQKVLKALGTALESVAAVIQPFISVITTVVIEFANQARMAADMLVAAIDKIRAARGKGPLYDPNAKTAVAARQAQIGDLRGFANRAYTSAYNSSGGGTSSEEVKAIKEGNNTLHDILNIISLGLGGQANAAGRIYRGDRSGATFREAAAPGPGLIASLSRMAVRLF